MSKRVSWEEYFISLALAVAARSPDPFRKVGAVCASSKNRILSTGYNGLPPGVEPPPDLYNNRENPLRFELTIHAERNALDLCDKGAVDTIATTCSPCSGCAKLIADYKVRRVLYFQEYHRETSFKKIFESNGILYIPVQPPKIFLPDFLDFITLPTI